MPGVPAPSALAATATDAVIAVTWTDESAGAASTIVQRSPNGSTGWETVGTSPAGIEYYMDTVTASGTYYYRVYGSFNGELSIASSTASDTVSITIPPPTLFAATVDGSSIVLTWSDSSEGTAQHVIESSTDGVSGWSAVATKSEGVETHTVTSLSAGTYYYRIQADNGVDTSTYATANATIAASELDSPTALSATASGSTVTIDWTNGEPSASTVIERGTDGETWPYFITKDPGVDTHDDTGLSDGTYYYRARHYLAGNYSGYTSSDSATVASSAGSRTLTGTGFGSEPTVLIFDRATGTAGASYSLTADVGTWSRYNNVGAGKNTDVRYLSHAGRTWMAGRQISLVGTSAAELGGVILDAESAYSEYYLEYRVVVPTGYCLPGAYPNTNSKTWTDTDSRWKLTWAWNSAYSATTTTDCCYPTLVPTASFSMTGNAMTPRYGSAASNSGVGYSMSLFSATNENIIGAYVKVGTSATAFDGVVETFQANGAAVSRNVITNARPFHGRTDPIPVASHDTFVFCAWQGNVNHTNVQHGWADMYLAVGANAQARVYAHNAPTLAGSSQVYNVTACKSSWSGTSITVTGLEARESLTYMSVISADGTLHENVSWS